MKGIFETPKCQLEEVEVNARILVEGVTLDTSARSKVVKAIPEEATLVAIFSIALQHPPHGWRTASWGGVGGVYLHPKVPRVRGDHHGSYQNCITNPTSECMAIICRKVYEDH
eukprot:scaffold656_cov403-Pavlova_lutheri.AAC.26